ncbi:MAG TPA: phage holin family protein [Gemmataceae bacterium]|nr:phage holin family protein [Gemmataceae bacterium]
MIDTPLSDGTRQQLPAPASGRESTVTELIAGIAEDAQRLIQQQYQMLRAEVKEDIRRTKSALTYMSAGIVASLIGVVFLVVALPLLLNWTFNLPDWAGWAIIGILMLLLGIVGLFAGRRIFEKYNPLPDKTLNALEENLSWIANRRN